MSQWLGRIWTRLTEPARMEDARDAQFSRLLNIILLCLFAVSLASEVRYWLAGGSVDARNVIVWFILAGLAFAYAVNHRGYLFLATLATLGLFIAATFAFAVLQHLQGGDDLAILHYLIIAILIGELFLSTRG